MKSNKPSLAPKVVETPASIRVCIIGGGHAAHAFACLLPWKGIPTRLYSGFENEAALIQKSIKEHGSIEATFAKHLNPSGLIKGTPEVVSNDPSVITGCNVLLLPLPAFAYKDSLKAIQPYIQKGMFIGATPGQGGFDWIARHFLGDIVDDVTLFSITPMPFNCRITSYGRHVNVQQYETHYQVTASPQQNLQAVVGVNRRLLGDTDGMGHFLTCTLQPLNPNIHPQHMYALLGHWHEGQTFDHIPFFYDTMGPASNKLMMATSEEVQRIAEVLRTQLGLDVRPLTIWESECSEFNDPSLTVDQVFRTSPAYRGFRAPFKKLREGEFVPDFTNRYFTEDVPYGLAVWKGLGELTGVSTPTIDEILGWCQRMMGKEYIVNGRFNGRDVKETSAPQAYGIFTLKQLVNKASSL